MLPLENKTLNGEKGPNGGSRLESNKRLMKKKMERLAVVEDEGDKGAFTSSKRRVSFR